MKKFHPENHLERLFTILLNPEELEVRNMLKEKMQFH